MDSMPALEGSAANVRPDDSSGGSMADAVHGVHPDVKAEGTAGSAAVAGPAAKAESSEPEAECGGKVSRRQPVFEFDIKKANNAGRCCWSTAGTAVHAVCIAVQQHAALPACQHARCRHTMPASRLMGSATCTQHGLLPSKQRSLHAIKLEADT